MADTPEVDEPLYVQPPPPSRSFSVGLLAGVVLGLGLVLLFLVVMFK